MSRPAIERRYFTCQNPKCRRQKRVKYPSEQKHRRFCSRRCVGAVCGPVATFTLEHRLRLAEKSKRTRRAKAMAKLKDLSPVAIYRMAFSTGWKAGVRSARRRMGLA